MKKSEQLLDLLETLEPDEETVKIGKQSKIIVTIDGDELTLSGADCQKLFQSVDTATDFFNTLEDGGEGEVEIHCVDLDSDVFDYLEEVFANVEVY